MMRVYRVAWGDGYTDALYVASSRAKAGGRALRDLRDAGLWRPGLSLMGLRVSHAAGWDPEFRAEPDGPARPLYPVGRPR